jgi:hypothetical protein
MQGDELTTAVFFAGSGIALVIAAVNQAGWKHRVLIWGLLGSGVLFCLVGLFLPIILRLSPTAASVAVGMATAPSSWFTVIFSIAVLIVVSKNPTKTPIKLPITSQPNATAMAELERKVDLLDSFVSEHLAQIRMKLNSIDERIAIDMPNATTVAEAFTNLHDSVHAKVKRISEQIQGYSERLGRDNLDLQHTLYSAILSSTEQSLLYLISIAPRIDANEDGELAPEAFKINADYLAAVANELSGSQRFSDFRNVMIDAEGSADERLKVLPRDQWPEHLNHIDTQKYFRAAFQRRRVVEFLERQLKGVRDSIRLGRGRLVEQYEQREQRR